MDDLIYRQDAIDAVTKRIEKSECGETVDHDKVIADIKSLPSIGEQVDGLETAIDALCNIGFKQSVKLTEIDAWRWQPEGK